MPKEYIEREALLCMVQPDDPGDEMAVITIATAKKLIRSLAHCCPADDVAPVRHGEWLNFYGDFSTAECELCAELYEVSPDESPQKEYFDAFKEFYRYCPNCGAKMDGERKKGAGNE